MKKVFCLLLLLLFSANSTSASVSIYADYDYSNLTDYSQGELEDGTPTSTQYQGNLNSTRVGAYIGQPDTPFLFGLDFLYGSGQTPGERTSGAYVYPLTATTTKENARLYAGYLLHTNGDGQIRAGYGFERITITVFDVYPKQSMFNYLFLEYCDDLLRSGKSSVQADVMIRYNFLSKAENLSPNYNETVFFDQLQTSFGFGLSLPISYGFNDNISLNVTPWFSYNKRGLGTSTTFVQAGQEFVLADATFTEYGMSCGVKLSF